MLRSSKGGGNKERKKGRAKRRLNHDKQSEHSVERAIFSPRGLQLGRERVDGLTEKTEGDVPHNVNKAATEQTNTFHSVLPECNADRQQWVVVTAEPSRRGVESYRCVLLYRGRRGFGYKNITPPRWRFKKKKHNKKICVPNQQLLKDTT